MSISKSINVVCGFHIEKWQKLGFNFQVSDWFEGGQIWYAEKQFDELILSLRINTSSGYTLAKIETLERHKIGNHVVNEITAFKWFSEKSELFAGYKSRGLCD